MCINPRSYNYGDAVNLYSKFFYKDLHEDPL